jgi:hypothetical protein
MHHMLCRSWQDPMPNLQTLVNCFLRVPWIHMLTTLTRLTERYFLVFLLADLTYWPLDISIWSNVACIRICNVLESLHSIILNYVRATLNSSRLVETCNHVISILPVLLMATIWIANITSITVISCCSLAAYAWRYALCKRDDDVWDAKSHSATVMNQ